MVEEMTLDWLNTAAIDRAELIRVFAAAAFQFLGWAAVAPADSI